MPTTTQKIKALNRASLFTRHRLEHLGSWLEQINHKRNPAISHRPADLTSGQSHLFKEKVREQAFKNKNVNRFASYGEFLRKYFPNGSSKLNGNLNSSDDNIDKAIDMVFAQIAKLAEGWSRTDIIGEKRFARVMQMDETERNVLAQDICNQNRALATLGGTTGMAGFAGLFADTFWLLIVSLRTIYQLALVYGKPLTGKQGMETAYAIIASSDLQKMQEKQTIQVTLNVVNNLLANTQQNGLKQALKTEGKKHQAVSGYVDDIDAFLEQLHIDLDNIDLSWLKKLLPVSSVAVGMHYNSILIEEVIGVAQATLAPETKLATTMVDVA